MELKRILWPTDLSEKAAEALPLVTSLSEKYQAEIHLLYVVEEIGHFGAWYGEFDRSHIEKLQEMEKKIAEERLAEICTRHLEGCPLYIRHLATGDPAGEILKTVDREKPDLVVMATQGRNSRFGFGAVAEKVIRHSPVPVLSVPVKGS
jgi:nucleotide-binding universal stress UspA family protein